MVSNLWWYIEHITRIQHPFIGGLEVGNDFQISAGRKRGIVVATLPYLPTTLASSLQQEHIIVVKMRAYAAASFGIADHNIVKPPGRQKVKFM